jgi:hypothetical protein
LLVNISDLKIALLICRDAKISSFVWGHRGLGKSQTHKQLAESQRWGFLDLRCSQMEASDLRGLPDREDGLTVYRAPADLPQGHKADVKCPACDESVPVENYPQNRYCKGLLFLDELNRAEDDVLQAGFQLVLDRRVGMYKIPDGWSVHCAGNYSEGYLVNSFSDPAFLDRFCHFDLGPSDEYYQDWTEYMGKYAGTADRILQFVGFNKEHLIGAVKGERGFSVQPSPRSWEMVAKVEEVCKGDNYPRGVKREVLAGLIGRELALQFERFTCTVTPSEVLNKGLKHVKDRLEGLNRTELVGLVWGVAANAKQDKKEEGMMANVLDFMGWVAEGKEKDLAVSLGRSLVSGETSGLAGAVLSNPHLARLAQKFRKPAKKGEPSWIAMINERKELQTLMSKVSYGK